MGMVKYRNYPLFYDVEKEQIYDLVKELKSAKIYCKNCGRELTLKNKPCQFCGVYVHTG